MRGATHLEGRMEMLFLEIWVELVLEAGDEVKEVLELM